jgi:hypothetical protein
MAPKKRRARVIPANWDEVTQAKAEPYRAKWENSLLEENKGLTPGRKLDRCLLTMDWDSRFGWFGLARTLDYSINHPWTRLRKLYIERGMK